MREPIEDGHIGSQAVGGWWVRTRICMLRRRWRKWWGWWRKMAVAPYAHGMGGYASSSFSLALSFILSCSLSEWDAVGGVGGNGTERQKGESGGTKHGPSEENRKGGATRLADLV